MNSRISEATPAAPESSAPSRSASPEDASKLPLVVLLGNPNVGKTTLFNRLAGQSARVGNYPGVTVERRSASLVLPPAQVESSRARATTPAAETRRVELVDVPGAYSLSARSQEERIAFDAALGFDGNARPALAVIVVDAGQLIRNLYLVVQLLELRVPAVVAVNMIDEAGSAPPNVAALAEVLGVPCVATNGRDGIGIPELKQAIRTALDTPPAPLVHVSYPSELKREIDAIAEHLPAAWRGSVERDRALALWALSSLDGDDELEGIPDALRAAVARVNATGRDIDLEITTARYAYLDAQRPRLFTGGPARSSRHYSERVDKLLLHPVFGFAAFLAMMVVVFQSLFTWSDPAIGLIEDVIGFLQGTVQENLPGGILRDLLSEGVLGGVGNVIVFLPQILLLFLFVGLLEDSGYMARVAYLMDRVMKSLGLHGRAFVPMLSGFACAVPAILATRTMERQRDRLLTMLVVPLMTCSARLPVYTLIIAALFPPTSWLGLPVQGLLMVFMYLFSMVVALLAAAVLGRTAVPGKRVPLILELPPYRLPRLRETMRMMTERAGQFLREAGTVILACTVLLWALLSFPRTSPVDTSPSGPATVAAAAPAARTEAPADTPEAASAPGTVDSVAVDAAKVDSAAVDAGSVAPSLEDSYGGRLGKLVEPLVRPIGFDWKLATGIIGAFAAREVFVSTLGLVYGIGDTDDEALPLRDKLRSERRADGAAAYTPLIGLSLMVFFALACQCMSTLAVVRRETKTWRWPAFLFVYMTGLAYLSSLLVYQGGLLLGFAG
jgi:ferrous iron transport protein B